MRLHRSLLLTALAVAVTAPLPAQTIDTAQARFQQPVTIQYLRAQDKRGMNVFETTKDPGVEYNGFKLAWGAAFTQQFQALQHSNTADSVPTSGTNPVNRNRLMPIGNNFNNATANMYLHAQLAPGIRVQLTSYLSTRHHNETWVKDGYLQMDQSPVNVAALNTLMKYATVKIGQFEVNYGDMHFRRTDNGQALYNPFVGNAIMDAFSTEVGAEVDLQHNGLLGVLAISNGESRGRVDQPAQRAPAYMVKVGFDKQVNEDLRIRLTGSLRTQSSAISNVIFGGDRAGSRYYFVMENTAATESAQAFSGRLNPGMRDNSNEWVINPFVKYNGLEFFGMYETAKGKASTETVDREVKQSMVELVYRFLPGEKLYVGGRWNSVTGDIGGGNTDIEVTRTNVGGGWFITPSLLLKLEYVNQDYKKFLTTDIRNGGRFKGFMIEAVTAF